MSVTVALHHVKDFAAWLKLFKENSPRRSAAGDCSVVPTTATAFISSDVAASEVKTVKDFVASERMQDVFRRVNAMSTTPVEFVWLEEQTP